MTALLGMSGCASESNPTEQDILTATNSRPAVTVDYGPPRDNSSAASTVSAELPPTNTSTPEPTETLTPEPANTPTSEPTDTPTPDPTNIPTSTETPSVPEANAKDASNLRSGPGTNYGVLGGLKAGERVEVVGKNTDGSWLQVETATGKTAWVKASLVNASGVANVEVVQAPPTPKVAPTATRRPEVVNGIGTITNNTGRNLPFFDAPNGNRTGEFFPNGASTTVYKHIPNWFQIDHRWVLDFNIDFTPIGGATVRIEVPTAAPLPTSDGLSTNSRFEGFSTPNHPQFARPIDLVISDPAQLQARTYYSGYPNLTCTAITSVGENEDGNLTAYQERPITYEAGSVVSATSAADGSLSVTIKKPDDTIAIIRITSDMPIRLLTEDPETGATFCVNPYLKGVRASYLVLQP